MKNATRTAAAMAVLAGITGFMITGCSAGSAGPGQNAKPVSQEEFDKAMETPTQTHVLDVGA